LAGSTDNTIPVIVHVNSLLRHVITIGVVPPSVSVTVSVRLQAGFDAVLASISYEPAESESNVNWVVNPAPSMLYSNHVPPVHVTIICPSFHQHTLGSLICTDQAIAQKSSGPGSHADGDTVYHQNSLFDVSVTVHAT
jgi:hypothetical protein